MKRFTTILFVLILLTPLAGRAQAVYTITVEATINPPVADFIERAIQKAAKEKGSCLIIQLNTPGGLLSSTRHIAGSILNAPLPVIVYVSPAGAHAGSAGMFVTLCGHIAAMAPGTNIGAAHPVTMQGQMDSVMMAKATNDAAAFVRTIAQKRNRNVEWAEEAVRNSVSITASEALEKKVIDVVADDVTDLVRSIDGKTVEVRSQQVTLHTRDAEIKEIPMSFAEKLMNTLSDPNIAYILLILGFYGIFFELYNPGAIIPGIVGVIGLILGFYALNTLPLNYAGLALILFGIILFLLEIKVTSYGILTIGGIVSLALGSLMLIRPDKTFAFPGIALSVIITTTVITALFFLFIVGMGLRAQRAKPTIGVESFAGEMASVVDELNPKGSVRLHGEIWTAESVEGTIKAGENVRVVRMKDLILYVEPLKV